MWQKPEVCQKPFFGIFAKVINFEKFNKLSS